MNYNEEPVDKIIKVDMYLIYWKETSNPGGDIILEV